MTLTASAIRLGRLHSNRLAANPCTTAEELVSWLGAVQAQDHTAAKWAISVRTEGVTDGALDGMLNAGAVVRTHVLRPTWHLVAPQDIRWMLRLTGPRVKATLGYYDRLLGIDVDLVSRSNALFESTLHDNVALTRVELAAAFNRAGLEASNQRLGHLLMHAELDAVICSGGLRGRRFTYALLDERVPVGPDLDGDAALGELAARYFRGHGPARLRDFVWWSGLTTAQARRGIAVAPSVETIDVDGVAYHLAAGTDMAASRRQLVHLLPNYDEYLVGYTDRMLHRPGGPAAGMELLANGIVIDGRVVGGWSRVTTAGGVTLTLRPAVSLTAAQRNGLAHVAQRYGSFADKPVRLVYDAA